jgi:hypothetical protein
MMLVIPQHHNAAWLVEPKAVLQAVFNALHIIDTAVERLHVTTSR